MKPARLALAGSLVAVAFAGASSPAHAQFGAEQIITSGLARMEGLHAADLDGNGDVDVIACRAATPALSWYRNLGGGAFGPAQPFPAQPHSASDAVTLDLDNDGDLDVVAAVDYYTPRLGSDVQLVLYRNQGGASFPSGVHIEHIISATDGLSVADLEGDGDLDLFYTEWSYASVYVKQNLGSHFGAPQLLTNQAMAPRDIHPADLDGDGDADLLVASYTLNEIMWFENISGTGPFGPKHVLNGQADGAHDVDAADLDGDGDLEPLSASSFGNDKEVHWYENLGGGAFGSTQLLTNIGFPGGDVRGVDFDGDSDMDVLVSEFYGASWYPNHGGGNFGSRQVITAATIGGAHVQTPDLNGDGVPDLLLGSNPSSSGKIAWFENQVIGALGSNYCGPAVPNSTGLPGVMSAMGSPVVEVDKVRLIAANLPLNKVGIFIASQTPGFTPNPGGSLGNLCLGLPIKRLAPALHSGTAGRFELQLALSSSLSAPVQPGQTWNFQAWHRDVGGTSNLTDALKIDFAP